MKDAHQRGKASKRKGSGGELELVHLLNSKYGCHVGRGHVYYHEPDIIGLPGIHIEVKRVEHLNIIAAMEQAKKESKEKDGGVPTVFHRRNRGEWLVTMRLKDYMPMYKAWERENNE